MTMKWTLIVVLACVWLANSGKAASPYYNELRSLAAQNQQQNDPQITALDLWRYILSLEARSKIFSGNSRRTDQTRKRGGSSSCLFNAGLAHNCDYRDVVGAVNEMNHWGSDLAPGKRRKRESGSPDGILKRLLENSATRF